MIFETHAHYDDKMFDEDRESLLESMQEAGIGRIVNIGADLDVMVKFGPVFVSAGCNTLNFKYVDLNAGVGLFF